MNLFKYFDTNNGNTPAFSQSLKIITNSLNLNGKMLSPKYI